MPGKLRRLLGAVAPGVVVAVLLAGSGVAGASTGTAEISPEHAGYAASGAQFRHISASVYLRNPAQYAGEVASFGHSVQLWSSGLVVTVGLTTSTSGSAYTPYATVYDRSTHQVMASNPNAQYCEPSGDCFYDRPFTFPSGSRLTLTINYLPEEGEVAMFESSDHGYDFVSSYALTAQSFTQARVGTEFGSSPWDASYPHMAPASSVRIATYDHVDLTSYGGHKATLWSWWVHHKLLANTGQQSGSDWVAVPADLSNGGASFQTWFVPQGAEGPAQPVLP
jgi:hypothetical protein